MRERGWAIGLLAVLVLSFASLAGAADNYRLINGTTDFYFGHISLVDLKGDGKDPMVLREGASSAEPAALNLPLGPGDTILTSGERRVEVQFDNGTVIRLDVDSELKIEALMAQSLSASTKVSNLVLRRGRIYVMYKQYSSKELFQIIAPNAAVKMNHNAVATVGAPSGGGSVVQVAFGRANVLYGPNPDKLIEKTVYKGEMMAIDGTHSASFGAYDAASPFEAYNLEVNKNFDDLHKGKTMIPKPVQRLNSAVFYFAQQFGNLYGEWIYDDYFGYVWRPFTNDMRYPNGGWSPYYVGRWTDYNGQMFWVPSEPWGWIPYHLGVWQWNAKRGWYWIPGSAFAPAWVDWAFFGGAYYGWRPWSMWDWGAFGDYSWFGALWFGAYGYGYGHGYGYAWNGWGPWGYMGGDFGYWCWRYPWLALGPGGGDLVPPIVGRVDRGMLHRPGAAPFEMPREYKGGLKALMADLKNGNADAIASLQAVGRQTWVVGAGDLHKDGMDTRAVRLDQLMAVAGGLDPSSPQRVALSLPPRSAQNSVYNASRAFEQNARISALQRFVSRPAAGSAAAASASRAILRAGAGVPPMEAMRARDWNPDVHVGLRAGLSVVYQSGRNEIAIPQLGLRSSMAMDHTVLTPDGHVRLGWNDRAEGGSSGGGYSSGGSYAGGGSVSSGGGGGGSSSGGTVSTAGSSGGGSSSGGGGGGGHIRN